MSGYPDPQAQAEIRHNMITWFRTCTNAIWPVQHLTGSRFVTPPGMPPIVAHAVGYDVNPHTGEAMPIPSTAAVRQFDVLADYYAATFEQAKLYYISEEMTSLALRTEMAQYRLTAETLPSPVGFMLWGQPIGDAERYVPRNAWLGRDGTLTEADDIPPHMTRALPFINAGSPVIGAAWKYEPDHGQVWISIYTRNTGMLDVMRESLSPEQYAQALRFVGPLSFEREQSLPLDVTLNWFDADPGDGPQLTATAWTDPATVPETSRWKAEAAIKDVQPQLTAMVRTLVATWMLMKWKIAHREETPAPPYVVKQITRDTGRLRSEVREDTKTTVVRLGAPLRHRKPAKDSPSRKWKVRAVIGPYIRTRQYIPAWDVFDETPRLIEPYIAGPEGAPFSNTAEKVFLLE